MRLVALRGVRRMSQPVVDDALASCDCSQIAAESTHLAVCGRSPGYGPSLLVQGAQGGLQHVRQQR